MLPLSCPHSGRHALAFSCPNSARCASSTCCLPAFSCPCSARHAQFTRCVLPLFSPRSAHRMPPLSYSSSARCTPPLSSLLSGAQPDPPCYKISRLCHGPTTIEGIQYYLYILRLSDKAEIPAPLHNDYYSARTGRAFQRQGLPLPWTARNHHVRKRAAVCIQVLETPMLLPEDRTISVHCIISSNRQSNRVNECSNGATPIDLHQEPIGRLYRLSLSYHVHRTPQGIGFNHTISVHHQLRLPPLL